MLGRGDVSVALKVKTHKISANAQAKIEGAGGSVEIIQD
ncbi:MAG: uL15 family ribosomal protein [Anaerolineales bacterium]